MVKSMEEGTGKRPYDPEDVMGIIRGEVEVPEEVRKANPFIIPKKAFLAILEAADKADPTSLITHNTNLNIVRPSAVEEKTTDIEQPAP